MILRLGLLSGVVLATLMIGACATPLDNREELYATYQGALSTCRQQQGGRGNRKYRLPSTHPHIAQCLKRHGWNSDGTRRPKDELESEAQ